MVLEFDPTKQSLVKEMLRNEANQGLRITFTKKDGSDRTMRCTLVGTFIPEDKHPKGTGRLVTEDTCRVFDLDKQEWRSFRWDSVKRVEFSGGGE